MHIALTLLCLVLLFVILYRLRRMAVNTEGQELTTATPTQRVVIIPDPTVLADMVRTYNADGEFLVGLTMGEGGNLITVWESVEEVTPA
jgi:hypothetical protein